MKDVRPQDETELAEAEVVSAQDASGEDVPFAQDNPAETAAFSKDGGQEDWEEDSPLPPWKLTLLFLGLTAAAALICAVLWRVFHESGRREAESDAALSSGPAVSAEPLLPPLSSQEPMEEPSATPLFPDSADSPETLQGSQEPQEMSQETPQEAQPPAQTAPSNPAAENSAASGEGDMVFHSVQESVTPKDVVNLRSEPSTADDASVVLQAANGEILNRTGRNDDTGWSRIDYNGQSLYAVSQYLTTDLSYRPPVQADDPNRITTAGGRVILFTDCDDSMTPKEYVNLRTEPSTAGGDATVRCQVNNGQALRRTGYSPDSGWSRVEYNGEVLYVVSSLMTQATPAQ